MKNYIQPGNVLTLTAPYDLQSGDGALVGSVFGIASGDALETEEVELALVGVFTIAKATGSAWTAGAKIYWNNATKKATTTATDNTLIGVATKDATSAATIGEVRLNGAF